MLGLENSRAVRKVTGQTKGMKAHPVQLAEMKINRWISVSALRHPEVNMNAIMTA